MHGKESLNQKGCTSDEIFIKWSGGGGWVDLVCSIVVYLLCFLKIEKDIMVLSDNFDLLNKLKFVQIFQYLRQFSR